MKCLRLNICTCGACSNFSLQRLTLIANGIKGVTKKSTIAACFMLCPKKNDFNEDTKYDLSTYSRDCLYSKCKECTPKKIKAKLLDLNPEAEWNKQIMWHVWKSIQKTIGVKQCSGYERVECSGTLGKLLDIYCKQGKKMAVHLLNNEWQRNMYCTQCDRLQPGDIQLVIDYAKNHEHIYQNEPQSAHWDHTRTTFHPIAVSFPCTEHDCSATVTDEVVCITLRSKS